MKKSFIEDFILNLIKFYKSKKTTTKTEQNSTLPLSQNISTLSGLKNKYENLLFFYFRLLSLIAHQDEIKNCLFLFSFLFSLSIVKII